MQIQFTELVFVVRFVIEPVLKASDKKCYNF